MKNDKHKLFKTAKELQLILKTIEDLLDDYDGIDGNKNYVKYCRKKAHQANEDYDFLKQLYDMTYHVDIDKRTGININQLYKIVENYFKLLDDIDTAGDMFKPKWCKITSVIESLHKLRWLYCFVERDITDNDGSIDVNGNCFRKEERTILSL